MTRFVVDASITASILFDDEASKADAPVWAALRDGDVFVPAHWPVEMMSLLLKAERRKRVTRQRRDEHFAAARTLFAPAAIDPPRLSLDVLDLATIATLSAYDAEYLQLAIRLDATLATNDDALIAAARARGVAVLTTRP